MKFLILLPLVFVGCANVASTKFSYTDPDGSKVMIEMPKEVDAKELRVEINAKLGTAMIFAKEWFSRNSETIRAQAKREENFNALIEKASKGAVEGAMKSIIPIP